MTAPQRPSRTSPLSCRRRASHAGPRDHDPARPSRRRARTGLTVADGFVDTDFAPIRVRRDSQLPARRGPWRPHWWRKGRSEVGRNKQDLPASVASACMYIALKKELAEQEN